MLRVLVTGTSGHVGRSLIPLLAQEYEVYAVARTRQSDLPSNVTQVYANLLEESSIGEMIAQTRPEVLVHLAWRSYAPNYLESREHAAWEQASVRLFEAFCEHGGRRAVFAGSIYEQTLPHTDYSLAKSNLRKLVLSSPYSSGVSVAWCRIFGTYGPYDRMQRFIPSTIMSLIHGQVVRVQEPNACWDYLHVTDVGTAFKSAIESSFHGTFDVASGSAVSLSQLHATIEKLFRDPTDDSAQMSALNLRPTTPAVGCELSKHTNWKPALNLCEGLKRTIDWYRDQHAKQQPRM